MRRLDRRRAGDRERAVSDGALRMKRLVLMVVPLLAFAVAAARAQSDDEVLSSPKLRITWDEFKKKYDGGKVIVVDVRDAGSFAAGHIPKALSVPLPEIERRAPELKKLKKPVVLYCA
jgi:Rhodanese-like domain